MFFFNGVLQTSCNPWFADGLLFVKFFNCAWASNKLLVFDRYSFIEKLTSLLSLYKIFFHFIWLKSDINLLLSKFFQSRLRILDFVPGTFEKKSCEKINCRRWFENVDVTLPNSVSSNEVRFEKLLSINVDVLEILVGKNIRGNKKLELRISIKLFIESEISCFNKSILNSPRRKTLLDGFFCNFRYKWEINSFIKSLIGSVGCLYMQPTITLVDFEHIIFIKVESIFSGS